MIRWRRRNVGRRVIFKLRGIDGYLLPELIEGEIYEAGRSCWKIRYDQSVYSWKEAWIPNYDVFEIL